MLKKFLVSVLISVFIILTVDYAAYRIMVNKTFKNIDNKYIKIPSWTSDIFAPDEEPSLSWYEANKHKGIFRPVAGANYNKKSIWLFGCSFAYGNSLVIGRHPNEDSFGYILSKYTKRPVYNRAFPSWGVQHMLYMLENEDIYKEQKEPEYIVYTFIADHGRRLHKLVYDIWSNGAYLRYKLDKNGELKRLNGILVPLWKLHFIKLWLSYLEFSIRLSEKNHDKNFDILEAIFVKSKKIINEKYPDTKFVILIYNGNDGYDKWWVETDRWKELSDKGFVVVDLEKLTGIDLESEEYTDPDKYHPNKEAWIEISKKLSKEIIR